MDSLLFSLVRPLLNSEHDQRMPQSIFLFLPVVTLRQFQSMYKIKDPLGYPLFFCMYTGFHGSSETLGPLSKIKLNQPKGKEKELAFSRVPWRLFYLFKLIRVFSHIDISIHLLILWTLNCTEPSPRDLNESEMCGSLVLLKSCVIPCTHMVSLLSPQIKVSPDRLKGKNELNGPIFQAWI